MRTAQPGNGATLNGHPAQEIRPGRLLRLAALTLARSLAVLASLLAFPSTVPWMMAVWLAWHSVLVARRKPGWVPLAACAGITIIKRVPWPPVLIVLGLLMLAAGLLDVPRVRERIGPRCRWLPWAACAVL